MIISPGGIEYSDAFVADVVAGERLGHDYLRLGPGRSARLHLTGPGSRVRVEVGAGIEIVQRTPGGWDATFRPDVTGTWTERDRFEIDIQVGEHGIELAPASAPTSAVAPTSRVTTGSGAELHFNVLTAAPGSPRSDVCDCASRISPAWYCVDCHPPAS